MIGNANNRVESFESILDLFTLISFVLIIASFMYIGKPINGNNISNEVDISVLDAVSRTGVQPVLPKDVVLLVVSQEESRDKLSLLDGATGICSIFAVTPNTVENHLDKLESTFKRTNKIKIAVIDGPKQGANPLIVVAIQRWMAKHLHEKFTLSFVEES
jgi:hypothetical protein